MPGPRQRRGGRDHQDGPTGDHDAEHAQGREQQRVAADGDQHTAQHRAQGVAQAFPGAVAAEPAALAALGGESGDQHPGRRGERGRRGTLTEPGQPNPRRIAREHERGGGGGEREQTTQQHRTGADAVG